MVENKKDDKVSIDLLTLPFKSDYKVLTWSGLADGTALIPRFNFDQILLNKNFVLKSFQVVPYYSETESEIVEAYDSANQSRFVVPTANNVNYRAVRLFDRYEYGTEILMQINGARIPIFQQVNDSNIDPAVWVGYPLDLSLDNIYYYYPARLQSLDLSIEAFINFNLNSANNYQNPLVKVVIECYLF